MNKLKRGLCLFAVGAAGYSLIEIAFRGHTHWTMALTGGCCAVALEKMHRRCRRQKKSAAGICARGALIITAAEFAVGLVVNRLLGWKVWDYSDRPLNILGQICPLFSGLWFLLNIPLIPFFRWVDQALPAGGKTILLPKRS